MSIDKRMINDCVEALKTRERTDFNIYRGADMLRSGVELPQPGEALRMISYAGGFSSCSVVLWIGAQTKIDRLDISTLRVGKKEAIALAGLKAEGKLGQVTFILSGIAKENRRSGKDYGYTEFFEDICRQNGFWWRYEKNHSKVILLDTEIGKFCIETSSNFNENPKIEQFCITRDDAIYDFYKNGLFKDG